MYNYISGVISDPKCQNNAESGTLDVTLDEMQVLNLLKKDGRMTQKKLAEQIGKSERTVKRIISSLEEKGYVERVNGKRFGYWRVN